MYVLFVTLYLISPTNQVVSSSITSAAFVSQESCIAAGSAVVTRMTKPANGPNLMRQTAEYLCVAH